MPSQHESMAQGCVPLVIQDDPLSNSSVDQAFEEVLPWSQFSYRLMQKVSQRSSGSHMHMHIRIHLHMHSVERLPHKRQPSHT